MNWKKRAGSIGLAVIMGVLSASCGKTQTVEKEEVVDDSFTQYSVIANSGGKIEKYALTNSIEALDASYEKGIRLFDVDFLFTADDVLILRHDWDQTDFGQKKVASLLGQEFEKDAYGQSVIDSSLLPKYKTLQKQKVYGKFDTYTVEDLADWMSEHKDAYVLCDARQETVYAYQTIYEACNQKDPELLKQIVVECNNKEELENILAVYPFENILVRKLEGNGISYNDIIKMHRKYNVRGAILGTEQQNEFSVKRMKSNGMKIYWEQVDDLQSYQENFKRDGVVSDTLAEDELVEQE